MKMVLPARPVSLPEEPSVLALWPAKVHMFCHFVLILPGLIQKDERLKFQQ